MRFSQSKVVLHSNAAKHGKIWRTRLRNQDVLENGWSIGPWTSSNQSKMHFLSDGKIYLGIIRQLL